MTSEEFFEKFELFAELPDALSRMRELTLELAVRGKLSTRLQNDEFDPDWVAFVRSEPEEPRGGKPPFEIPAKWRWVRLTDVGTTKPKTEVADNAAVSFVPMALVPAEYGRNPKFEQRAWSEVKKSFTHFADGDVVMAKITPCFENGKSAIMRGLVNGVGAGTTELHVFRPATNVVLPEFVLLYLKTPGFISRGEARMTGSAGQKRVPASYFSSSPFPLPPLAEQKRIVAKVDELMALYDRLEAQQKERETRHAALARAAVSRFTEAPTRANLTLLFHSSYTIDPADLRTSVLTLAIQGKLLRQETDDGAASSLAERIQAERLTFAREHGYRQTSPLEAVDESTVPFRLPPTWTWCRLGSIVNVITDGDHLPPPRAQNGVAFLTIGNITTGRLDFEGCRFVPETYYLSLAHFRRPARHDILYTVVGATYGRPALVDTDRPFCVQRHIAILKTSHQVDIGFMMLLMRSPLVYSQATAGTTGTAQPTIPLGTLRNFLVPLPPLPEQRRIATKAAQLIALIEELEKHGTASHRVAGELLETVVAEMSA